MNATTTPESTALRHAAKAPRFDLYAAIHKALRQFMAHTLRQLGAMDVEDDEDMAQALAGVDALLAMLRSHLQHENDFLHTAIEARRAGGARHTADDHGLHQEAIASLAEELADLRAARTEQRAAIALRLYRHLAEFVGENLVHMQVEETRNNEALWAQYSDAELMALHDRLIATIDPAEMALVTRWMAASLSPQELAAVCLDMRAKAPAPAFEAALDIVRTQLDERRWAKLARALGRAPVPGLVAA